MHPKSASDVSIPTSLEGFAGGTYVQGTSGIPSDNPNHNHVRAIASGQVKLLPLISNA